MARAFQCLGCGGDHDNLRLGMVVLRDANDRDITRLEPMTIGEFFEKYPETSVRSNPARTPAAIMFEASLPKGQKIVGILGDEDLHLSQYPREKNGGWMLCDGRIYVAASLAELREQQSMTAISDALGDHATLADYPPSVAHALVGLASQDMLAKVIAAEAEGKPIARPWPYFDDEREVWVFSGPARDDERTTLTTADLLAAKDQETKQRRKNILSATGGNG